MQSRDLRLREKAGQCLLELYEKIINFYTLTFNRKLTNYERDFTITKSLN